MNESNEQRGHIKVEIGAQRGRIGGGQMPMKILALANFMQIGSDVPQAPNRISIDKNNFNEIMKRLGPRVTLDVANRLAPTPKEIAIELSFEDVKSFGPDAIVARVPALKELAALRQWLIELKEQKISRQELQERISVSEAGSELIGKLQGLLSGARPAPRASAQDAAPKSSSSAPAKSGGGKANLGSLFDMVDMGDGSQKPDRAPVSALEGLIDAIAHPKSGEEPVDKAAVDAAMGDIDSALSAQMNEILRHEKFQRLESTWRGLKFLVDRTDFRANIRIEILNAAKSDARDVIYQHVFRPEYDGLADEPISLMIAEYEFDRSPGDIETLHDLGRMAESIQVPFIASTAPAFFGVKALGTLPGLPSLADKFRQSEYAKWNGFRDTEQARWVALTANRFLLRLPYAPDGAPVKAFRFEKDGSSAASAQRRNYLWGSGVWALASAIAASFAETGWCADFIGPNSVGAVSNLPVREYTVHGGQKVNIPLEILIPDQRQSELADAGLVALTCRPNDDSACFVSARTTHRPKRFDDPQVTHESMLHATLPYQLFAGRMAQYLQKTQRDVARGLSKAEVEEMFRERMRSVLAGGGGSAGAEAAIVEVSENPEQPDCYDVVLRLRPPFSILGQSVDLLLGVAVLK